MPILNDSSIVKHIDNYETMQMMLNDLKDLLDIQRDFFFELKQDSDDPYTLGLVQEGIRNINTAMKTFVDFHKVMSLDVDIMIKVEAASHDYYKESADAFKRGLLQAENDGTITREQSKRILEAAICVNDTNADYTEKHEAEQEVAYDGF